MKPKRFAPGIFVVDEIGSLEAEEWVRQDYISKGLRPPPPRRLTSLPPSDTLGVSSTTEFCRHGRR